MKIDKNNIYVNIIFISIFLIFLDAYEFFSIPIVFPSQFHPVLTIPLEFLNYLFLEIVQKGPLVGC